MIKWLYACWLLRRALARSGFSRRRYFWQGLRVYVKGSDTTWLALPDAFIFITPQHVRAAEDYADAVRNDLPAPVDMTESPTSQVGGIGGTMLAFGYVPVNVTTQVSTVADGQITYWWRPAALPRE